MIALSGLIFRKPLRGCFCGCISIPPVAAYGVNWGLLAISPTGFFWGCISIPFFTVALFVTIFYSPFLGIFFGNS